MADSIHTRIRARRKELGLTQKQVGDKIGVTNSAVQQWEKGGSISSDHLPKLATALRTTLDYLLRGIPDNSESVTSSIIDIDMRSVPAIPLLPLGELMNLSSDRIVGNEGPWEKTVHTAHQWSKLARAFAMQDASMDPKFSELDIIVIDPEQGYDPGEYVAAFIKSLGITVFRQFRYDGPDHCILGAVNDHYRSYRFTHAEWQANVEVIGPWVEHIKVNKRSPKKHTS